MPSCLKPVWLWARCFSLMFVLLTVVGGCGKSPEGPASTTIPGGAAKADDPDFPIPDGSPEEIMKFANEVRSREPRFTSQEQMVDYLRRSRLALIAAADRILAQKAEPAMLSEATQLKLFTLVGMGAGDDPASTQGKAMAKFTLDVVNHLRQDVRPEVADAAKEFWIAARALNLPSMSPSERTNLSDEAIQYVTDSKMSLPSLRDASFLTDRYQMIGEMEASADLCDRLSRLLADSPDEQLRKLSNSFVIKARRLRLPGSFLELEGQLFGGGELDWNSYRGKVVLVDFWATWCGPCLAELPNVEANYKRYHARGFEVVGISLDRSKKTLESFLEKRALPWVQLYQEPANGASEWQHPMAEKYGISSIPAAFLVDQDGKVVSTEARGEELDRLLAKLLKPKGR